MQTPRKWPGRDCAAEREADAFFIDPGGEARRVHFLGARGEDEIDAGFAAEAALAGEGARIAGEVFLGAELRGVHEDADGDGAARAGELAGAGEEGEMAGVERTHGGDEDEGAGGIAAGCGGAGDGGDGFQTAEFRTSIW